MNAKMVGAFFGFAFVAMWIATNIGYAVLCLVGAAVFYTAIGAFTGEIDLGETQDRFLNGRRRSTASRPARPRVQ